MLTVTISPVSRLDASTDSIIECLPHACPTFEDPSLWGGARFMAAVMDAIAMLTEDEREG